MLTISTSILYILAFWMFIWLSVHFWRPTFHHHGHFGIINLVPTINMFDIVTMVSVALQDIGSGNSGATVVSISQVCASSSLMTDCTKYRVSIKITNKCLPGHIGTIRFTSVRRVSAVDNFPTRWCTSTLGVTHSSVFGCNISKQVDWDRWSNTLTTTIARYHPLLDFFWHQFQILQIWRQE